VGDHPDGLCRHIDGVLAAVDVWCVAHARSITAGVSWPRAYRPSHAPEVSDRGNSRPLGWSIFPSNPGIHRSSLKKLVWKQISEAGSFVNGCSPKLLGPAMGNRICRTLDASGVGIPRARIASDLRRQDCLPLSGRLGRFDGTLPVLERRRLAC
jgi:hypothetical protein